MQEAVTGRQMGDHLGNISMSVWNCRAPAGGPGVCEGEAGGGERNPRPQPLLMETPDPRLCGSSFVGKCQLSGVCVKRM